MTRESAHYLQNLAERIVEQMSEGVVIENAAGYFTFVNPAAAALLGYATPGDLIGKHWTLIVPPDQHPIVNAMDERRARGETDRYELELVRRDGARLSVIVAASPYYENGAWAGALAVFTDITERQRAAELLRASEERYQHATRATGQLIYDYDLPTGQIRWAGAIQTVTGFTPEEFASTDIHAWEALIHPDDRAEALAQLERAQQEQRVYHVEYRFRRKDDTYVWIEDWGIFLCNAAGEIHRMIGAMRDITERKHAEAALRHREAILDAVAFAADQLFQTSDWQPNIHVILQRLGQATEVSRVYIFENHRDADGTLLTSQRYEWVAPGITPQIDNPNLQGVPYDQVGLTRWVEQLSRRQTIYGNIRDFPPSEREILAAQDIRSIVIVPIFVGTQWWGFIGFDECSRERTWSLAEIDALRIAADNLGSAMARSHAEDVLRHRAAEFFALYETAQDLASQTDLATLLQTIIAHATALLDASSGAIFLYDAATHQVELAVTQNFPLAPPLRLNLGEGMAGRVAQTRQPLIVDDYSRWEHHIPQTEGIPFRASLNVPMIFGGELIGVLDVSEMGDSTRKFTEEDARLMTLFAAQAASAVYNARLLRQAQERAAQLTLLYDAALALNRALEPRQAIEHLLRIANQSVEADRVDFFRYDSATRALTFDSGSGYAEHLVPRLKELYFNEGEPRGIVGWVAQERVPLYLPDVRKDSRWIPIDLQVRSGYWVPVEHESKLFGILVVTSTRVDAFPPAHQRLILLFANQVAATLERALLFQAEQNRRAELSALYDLARVLTDTDTLEAIGDLVVRHAFAALPISCAHLALLEGDALVVRAVAPSQVGDRELSVGARAPLRDLPRLQEVLQSNQPVVLRAEDSPSASERALMFFDALPVVCAVPLRAGKQSLGVLLLGELTDPDQLRRARHIGDQAASAIRRVKLREQTEQRLRQLQALHAIDLAIASSLDANVTMNVFLPQAIAQLGADAACVLRYHSTSQLLTYLAGQGFRTKAIQQTTLRIGGEIAGRAALERAVIHQVALIEQKASLQRDFLLTDERFVSCVCAPLVAKGELKGVLELYFRAPFTPTTEWLNLLQTLSTQAALALDNAELFNRLQQSHRELTLAYEATILGWARTIELHDAATRGHAERTAELTLALARAAGVPEAELRSMRYGALLHNIGKLSLPDELWRQRDVPNAKEQALIREHPQKAYEILSASAFLRPLLDIPYCFLENWDGSGYPRGLAGEQIPLAARIFAVADTWDSALLRSTAPPEIARAEARALLQAQSGKRLDPRLTQLFLRVVVGNAEGV